MAFIDFRFRPCVKAVVDSILNNPAFSGFVANSGFGRGAVPTLEEEVALFKGLGGEKFIMNGRDCESVSKAASSNPGVLEAMRAFPDEIIGFYGVDPYKGMSAIKAFKRAVLEDGFAGASIDGDICRMENTSPVHVDRVAADFPEQRIVMSHAGWNFPQQALATVFRNENVYMDISDMTMNMWMDFYVTNINSYLSEKVFFGSAHPFTHLSEALYVMKGYDFAEGVREKVMYENAKRFLRLP